jgi:hypothetical protein
MLVSDSQGALQGSELARAGVRRPALASAASGAGGRAFESRRAHWGTSSPRFTFRDSGGSFAVEEHRRELFEAAQRVDLEGIVAKREADPYSPQTVRYKVKNFAYTQAEGRGDLF